MYRVLAVPSSVHLLSLVLRPSLLTVIPTVQTKHGEVCGHRAQLCSALPAAPLLRPHGRTCCLHSHCSGSIIPSPPPFSDIVIHSNLMSERIDRCRPNKQLEEGRGSVGVCLAKRCVSPGLAGSGLGRSPVCAAQHFSLGEYAPRDR